MYRLLLAILIFFASASHASPHAFVDRWLKRDLSLLEQAAVELEVAAPDCHSESFLAAYHDVFDVWNRVQLIRFGPLANGDLAFQFQFWPERKGIIGKKIRMLVASGDPVVQNPKSFRETSIAARGLMAIDYALFDADFLVNTSVAARCQLMRAVSQDLRRSVRQLTREWSSEAWAMYRHSTVSQPLSDAEIHSVLYTALDTSLQYDIDLRLGKPLGSFNRAFPRKAEAWRSGRTLRNLENSLKQSEEVAVFLAGEAAIKPEHFRALYHNAYTALQRLDHELDLVERPGYRIRAEALQQKIQLIRESVRSTLGPQLGVQQGFNALDGD